MLAEVKPKTGEKRLDPLLAEFVKELARAAVRREIWEEQRAAKKAAGAPEEEK